MKRFFTAMIVLLVAVTCLGAIDIVIPRDYASRGFALRGEGMPDFIIDESIYKANTQGYTITSVTKRVFEISDGSNRIFVALGADRLDLLALDKILSIDSSNLLLFIGLDTGVSGSFFAKYPFKYVAMQSYTPDMMKGIRESGSFSFPFKYSDAVRVNGDTVEFVSMKKGQEAPVLDGELVEKDGKETVLVICPHCGETIKIRI